MMPTQHKKTYISFLRGKHLCLALFMAMCLLFAPKTIKSAQAYCCVCEFCAATTASHIATETAIQFNLSSQTQQTVQWFQTFWAANILPALKMMTMEMDTSAFAMQAAIGALIDGNVQQNALLEIQEAHARIAREQTPAVSMCRFASLGRSLASSEAKSRATASFLAKRSLERETGGNNRLGGSSEAVDNLSDHLTRYTQYLSNYCDPKDFQNGLWNVQGCVGAANPKPSYYRPNRDIDYTNLFDSALTLNIDFSDNVYTAGGGGNLVNVTADEADIMALSANLFSNELINRDLYQFEGEARRQQYQNFRAIMAKRNVAEHSFNTLVGLKSSGSGASAAQMAGLLTEIMINDPTHADYVQTVQSQAELLLPNEFNLDSQAGYANSPGSDPSYYAQMDFLTQKIFQSPRFFADLYDNPANVDRQYAAMQALGLMQRREAYESMIRSELLASLLLEMTIE
ncbi:MAG: hypothetical protein CL561_13170 [Alphaproteobacteria bacterium]|nr:hypothetical protein [Alphaproteobacteria bacterium]|tara:strand:+ start:1947 stop:3320 length:1374 start_codon:yes stop_codon:yes gene_type:complete